MIERALRYLVAAAAAVPAVLLFCIAVVMGWKILMFAVSL